MKAIFKFKKVEVFICLTFSILYFGCSAKTLQSTNYSKQKIADGIWIDRLKGEVEIVGEWAGQCDWLEQIVCFKGTRDHEVLVTTKVLPSIVHAALLAIGARSGNPGGWYWEEEMARPVFPSGQEVEVFIGTLGKDLKPARYWVEQLTLDDQFLFTGSVEFKNRYEADWSGSLIGLVTFGDETIGLSRVVSDSSEDATVIFTSIKNLPKEGEKAKIIIRLVGESQ